MTTNGAKISVTILTRNSEKYLAEVLESVQKFEEVIVLDEQSSDNTLTIAQRFQNTKIYNALKHITGEGFGARHNYASSLASSDWILSLDSDEVLSQELADEILSLDLADQWVYSVPLHNYFNGKRIRTSGWNRERKIRIYNRMATRFSDDYVHERILSENLQEIKLQHPILHYTVVSSSDFLHKMQFYSELFAIQNKGIKTASPAKALTHCIFTFLKKYILQRGFLDGYEGFLIASYDAHTTLYKYLKLYEKNKKQ